VRPDDTLRDRAVGALVGTAVGDALGAPFEGAGRVDAAELRRVLDGDQAMQVTDDAVMTAGLARSLLACGGFDGEHLARTFAADHDAEPWRGYGAGPPRIFRMLRDGADWADAPRQLYGGEGSLGNGGTMRVAPAALAAHPDPELERTADLARLSASVTHAHPIGQDGAALAGARDGASAIPDAWRRRAELTGELAGLASELVEREVTA
jgi:poly(ADP-ribose) glycohydrolase ARH3